MDEILNSCSVSSTPVVQIPSSIAQRQMLHRIISISSRSATFYLFLHECPNDDTYYIPLLEFLKLLTELLPDVKGLIQNKKQHLYRRQTSKDLQIFATYQRNIVITNKSKIDLLNCEFMSCRDILSLLDSWHIDSPHYQIIVDFLQHFLMGYIQAKALAWLMLTSNLFL